MKIYLNLKAKPKEDSQLRILDYNKKYYQKKRKINKERNLLAL